jgi:hypothetical protein
MAHASKYLGTFFILIILAVMLLVFNSLEISWLIATEKLIMNGVFGAFMLMLMIFSVKD